MIQNSIALNKASELHVRVRHGGGTTYDLYIAGRRGSEFSHVSGHPDEGWIRKIVARLETPKRVKSRSGREIIFKAEFFESSNENNSEWRNELDSGGMLAIPGKLRHTGLRLYCLEWGKRTIIWLKFIDKKGWKGRWQDKKELREQIAPYVLIHKDIDAQILTGALLINEDGRMFGFRYYEDDEPENIIKLDFLT